mmetsp:Transcript_39682/g.79310  ORF Transcript_39682/g.79310 Transcript_39682/m.79310 type:complete len:86 (-) Transcript_39682:290-547(-)
MTMLYEGGEPCDGTPRRARIEVECGEEDVLHSVSEPSVCVYLAHFRSPSACSTETLRTQHLALEQAASKAGLPYTPSETLLKLLR